MDIRFTTASLGNPTRPVDNKGTGILHFGSDAWERKKLVCRRNNENNLYLYSFLQIKLKYILKGRKTKIR